MLHNKRCVCCSNEFHLTSFVSNFGYHQDLIDEKFYLKCYVKCMVLKATTLKLLHIFTARSCDTTKYLRFLAVMMQFPVRFFLVQNIEDFFFFFTFKTGQKTCPISFLFDPTSQIFISDIWIEFFPVVMTQ